MKIKIFSSLSVLISLAACASAPQFKPVEDMNKFYSDKLSCENLYTQGFNVWGNKVYGNVYQEGAARDCMLAKGYQSIGN